MCIRISETVIGTKISDDNSDWNECWPVVKNGLIIAVVDTEGSVIFGECEQIEYDDKNDYYVETE